jgi:2-keto-4-pentenoate hydratase/2-oxohepta-3-ene-1,7-dioic acid hydratase in catechol pathway
VALSGDRLLIPSLAPRILSEAAALPVSVRGLLASDAWLSRLKQVVDAAEEGNEARQNQLGKLGAIVASSDARFCAPVPDPIHFIGCGLAYRQHLQEMGGVPIPDHPVLFLCSPAALNGHRSTIPMPPHQGGMLDYEGELAIVIGKPCYHVSVSAAMDFVAGYTAHNDVSARDHVSEVAAVKVPIDMLGAWSRNVAAKQHPGFSPMGPYLVTVDEIPDPHALQLTVRVNGSVVQHVRTDDLIFSVAQYVSYVSHWFSLQPGDIISTGSPGGVGVAKKPPVFLRHDDEVTVEISGVGTLQNTVRSVTTGNTPVPS